MTVIDGRGWARSRLRYLFAAVDQAGPGQRAVIEAEMVALRRNAGFLTESGMHRWLRRVGPPADA